MHARARAAAGAVVAAAASPLWRCARRWRHALPPQPKSPPRRVDGGSSSVTPRSTDFSAWYHDVIAAADLVDAATPVRGAVIIKPHGYAMWDLLRSELDAAIRASGHVNAYFPLLIPASLLAREAAHVDGFAKECAVVTHSRLRAVRGGRDGATAVVPDPQSALSEPYVIRPTSETIIWDAFRRWIRTHADLPLLVNQWANVVRWEMRTRPFLRTSEFLWQEGHTAHATREEAVAEATAMAGMYRDICERVLAIPVVRGTKSASERFAGADETMTCEAIMQNGMALQSATSHFLGQNFARAFDVTFAPRGNDATRQHVWATSWGSSTRLLGGVIMSHSDDVGLVLPPAIAPVQVVIIPIAPGQSTGANGTAPSTEAVVATAEQLRGRLAAAGVRCRVDGDVGKPPGGRFYAWERKGVPLRIEVGARDLAAGTVTLRWRIAGSSRKTLPLQTGDPIAMVRADLQAVQDALFAEAQRRVRATVTMAATYEGDMVPAIGAAAAAAAAAVASGGKSLQPTPAFLLPWAPDDGNEAAVKAATGYTLRCYVDEGEGKRWGWADSGDLWQRIARGEVPCAFAGASGRRASKVALFAKAY